MTNATYKGIYSRELAYSLTALVHGRHGRQAGIALKQKLKSYWKARGRESQTEPGVGFWNLKAHLGPSDKTTPPNCS